MATVAAAPQAIPPVQKPKPSWYNRLINSTIGGKYLVAITGLALTGFVLTHMLGNLQIFLGRDVYNQYAHSLKSMGPLLWIARGGLLAFLLIHMIVSLRLQKRSLDARPVRYVYERTKAATVSARYMALTGLTIFFFIVFHLAHFTFGVIDRVEDRSLGETISYLDLKDPMWKDPATGATRHDAYRMFIDGFRNPAVVGFYIVCMVLLGFHMIHGVRSAFQTLGINSFKVNSGLDMLGLGITCLVVGANIIMPIAVITGLIGGDIPR
jgi:succinate dehydrogenase / fumarate reductase cytochrome b subunit